jgi:uncharacterized membrane protein
MSHHLLLAGVVALGFLLGGHHVAQATSFTFTTLDAPFRGTYVTTAFGINRRGQIAGNYIVPSPPDSPGVHGFRYTAGRFRTLDVPGAVLTHAYGINPRGQIVGRYGDGTTVHGFLYDGGVFTPIDVSGASITQAYGINPSGQIVGFYIDGTEFHGFLATPKKK